MNKFTEDSKKKTIFFSETSWNTADCFYADFIYCYIYCLSH